MWLFKKTKPNYGLMQGKNSTNQINFTTNLQNKDISPL